MKIASIALVCIGSLSFGQRIDWQTFRFTEENDFFNLTQRGIDRYYTQGFRFEWGYKVINRKFHERLLILLPHAMNTYTIGVSQQLYTPLRTQTYFYAGDRPYSGTLYLSAGVTSIDSAKRWRLSSRIDAGVLGPAAMGRATQQFFHKFIKNDFAVAWDSQIQNDLYLNYYLAGCYQLYRNPKIFQSCIGVELDAGTILNSIAGNAQLTLSNFNTEKERKFKRELFFKPELRFVMYNSLLQGGITRKMIGKEKYSEFLLNRINPVVYSYSFGFRISVHTYELRYSHTRLNPEFKGQKPHYFGTVQFLFPLSKLDRGNKN